MKKSLELKLKKIKLVITDVDGVLTDGVLTDGGMYYTKDGSTFRELADLILQVQNKN